MYYVYVLENSGKRRYIGQTDNLGYRLMRHRSNQVHSTKNRGPWKMIYTKLFKTRSEAMNYEKYLKNQKGGEGLKKILENT